MRRGPRNKYFAPQELARVGNLQLLARSVVEGYISGMHHSPFKGFSTEFAEYRQYLPGDDLKHFDWKVYARSDKQYVRLYEDETNMTVTLLLDSSGSMAYDGEGAEGGPGMGERIRDALVRDKDDETLGGLSKFDYACFLAAALTYLLVKQRDQVGMVIFSETVRERIPPRSSPAHMKFILDRMEETEPSGQTAVAATLNAIATSMKRRGLVVVISDLIDDQDAVVNALCHFRHDRHEVIVLNVFDQAEIDFPFRGLVEFKDLETAQRMQVRPEVIRDEYQSKFKDFVDKYRRDCRGAGIDYQFVTTQTPFDAVLTAYLAQRMRYSM